VRFLARSLLRLMNLRKDRGYVLREPSDAETPLLDRLVPSNDYPVDPAWLDAVLAAMSLVPDHTNGRQKLLVDLDKRVVTDY
jgi:hypothetical protein